MKAYTKPNIEFIELKPEERLACESGGSTGCCTGGHPGKGIGYLICNYSYPYGRSSCKPKFIILWFCK